MTGWLDIFSHSCSWDNKPNQLETKIQSRSQHLWKTLQRDLIVLYWRPSLSGQALNAPPRLWQPIPSHHHLSCFPCQSRCQVLLVKGHKYPGWKVGFSLILLIFLGKKGEEEKTDACPRNIWIFYIKQGPFLRQTWNSHLPWPKKQTLKHEKRGMLRLRNVDLPKAHFQSCVPTKINGRSKTPPLWQLSRMQVKRHPAGKGRTKVWNSLSGTRRRRPEGSLLTCHFQDRSSGTKFLENSCCQTQGEKGFGPCSCIMPRKNINTTRLHAVVQLPLQQQGTRCPKASLQSPYRPKWCKSRFDTLG